MQTETPTFDSSLEGPLAGDHISTRQVTPGKKRFITDSIGNAADGEVPVHPLRSHRQLDVHG
jgi:hypothetical protein